MYLPFHFLYSVFTFYHFLQELLLAQQQQAAAAVHDGPDEDARHVLSAAQRAIVDVARANVLALAQQHPLVSLFSYCTFFSLLSLFY